MFVRNLLFFIINKKIILAYDHNFQSMRLKFLILGLFIYLLSNTFGQVTEHVKDNLKFIGSVGIEIGQENFVSLPKFSAYASYNLLNNKDSTSDNLEKGCVYFGVEGSMFVFFAGAFSVSGTTGFQAGRLTLDCALTRLWLSDADGYSVGRQTTLNPKIGVMFGPVWIKAGPSLLLTNDDFISETLGNFMRIGNNYINVEVNYFLTW